jgi:hypothetical protein
VPAARTPARPTSSSSRRDSRSRIRRGMGSLARFTKPMTVLHDHDSGPSSHWDPITTAASGDTIVFDSSLAGQTITLTSGDLANKNLENVAGESWHACALLTGPASRGARIGRPEKRFGRAADCHASRVAQIRGRMRRELSQRRKPGSYRSSLPEPDNGWTPR